jgi:hypothetical protein
LYPTPVETTCRDLILQNAFRDAAIAKVRRFFCCTSIVSANPPAEVLSCDKAKGVEERPQRAIAGQLCHHVVQAVAFLFNVKLHMERPDVIPPT